MTLLCLHPAQAQQVVSLSVLGVRDGRVQLCVRLNAPAPSQGVPVTVSGAAYAAGTVSGQQTELLLNATLTQQSGSVATLIASGGGGTCSASITLPEKDEPGRRREPRPLWKR